MFLHQPLFIVVVQNGRTTMLQSEEMLQEHSSDHAATPDAKLTDDRLTLGHRTAAIGQHVDKSATAIWHHVTVDVNVVQKFFHLLQNAENERNHGRCSAGGRDGDNFLIRSGTQRQEVYEFRRRFQATVEQILQPTNVLFGLKINFTIVLNNIRVL